MANRIASSITFRLLSLFALTFSLCLGAAFTLAYFQVAHTLADADQKFLRARWDETAVFLRTTNDPKMMAAYLGGDEEELENFSFFLRLTDAQGQLVYAKNPEERGKTGTDGGLTAGPPGEPGWHSRWLSEQGAEFEYFAGKVGDHYFLELGRSAHARQRILDLLFWEFLLATSCFAALSVLIGLFYARSALAPLHKLTQAVLSIEKGDLSRRVLVTGRRDELHQLSEAFNRMIERIEKLIAAMRESLDDIAHDIRTPLTRIRNVAESALLSSSPEQSRRALEDCAENVAEISSFVDQLLEIAEAEAGALPLRLERASVRELVSEVAELYHYVAEDKSILLAAEQPLDLFWNLDRTKIKRVLANLVDNAVKFSPEGSTVTLRARSEGETLVLEVADQGKGIPDHELPRIWERLYRGDKSRTQRGAGLGLSVVRSIVLAHRGEVSVDSTVPGGSVFRVKLPTLDVQPRETKSIIDFFAHK